MKQSRKQWFNFRMFQFDVIIVKKWKQSILSHDNETETKRKRMWMEMGGNERERERKSEQIK